jgi:hypothetical protein
MHHSAAIFASLASLGLVCAIYYCNILSQAQSPARSEVLGMIMLALLTGLFPIAVGSALVGLWETVTSGFSLTALFASGVDLVSIGAIFATMVVFRMLVKATYRNMADPNNVTPLTPKPANLTSRPRRMKRAA